MPGGDRCDAPAPSALGPHGPAAGRFAAMIGTGGIGTGRFFALDGNHTLGREESRSGRFLDQRDYCKLHIVTHYVQVLGGIGFTTLPVGKVGRDAEGEQLLKEMRDVGLDLRLVTEEPDAPTMFALCLLYPDGSGGNLTVNDSASARVDAAFVASAQPEFARFEGRGIAAALPEVPLEARVKLLEMGTAHSFLRVAAFSSAEMGEIVGRGSKVLRLIDLMAVNLDEAAAAAGISSEGMRGQEVAEIAVGVLSRWHPNLKLMITSGPEGSWSWDGNTLMHVPAFPARVLSSAGAGDAHLAGTIVGLAAGWPLHTAHELGALVAAMSVTSPHTINKEITHASLLRFARTGAFRLVADVEGYLAHGGAI